LVPIKNFQLAPVKVCHPSGHEPVANAIMAPSGIKLSRSAIKEFQVTSVSLLSIEPVLYLLLKSHVLLLPPVAYVINTPHVMKNSKIDNRVQSFHASKIFFIFYIYKRIKIYNYSTY
jgi:hypothetical protein